jgi:hypothetical protein
MEYIVSATPEECLNRASSYLLAHGYSIDNRTENSATFSRNPEFKFSAFDACLWAILILISVGFAVVLALLLVALGIWKWKATVMAVPAPDGQTRLTVGGSNPKVEDTLKAWIAEEFREEQAGRRAGSEAVYTKQSTDAECLVFGDRIEVRGSSGVTEVMEASDIKEVRTGWGRMHAFAKVEIEGQDGRVLTIGHLHMLEARKLKKVIEQHTMSK